MTRVERNDDGFVVPVALLSETFGLDETEIRNRMRDGRLTSRCEIGQNEDEGRWRLSFRHEDRVFRLTVDDNGEILSRAMFPVPTSPSAGG